jgi:hypothetical protein
MGTETFYVDGDAANDAGNGQTSGTAKKYLESALGLLTGDDEMIIEVMVSTADVDIQAEAAVGAILSGTRNLTIRRYEGSGTATITTTNAPNSFVKVQGSTGGTIKFENLTLKIGDAAIAPIWINDKDTSLEVTSCVLDLESTSGKDAIRVDQDAATTRTVTLDGVTFLGGGGANSAGLDIDAFDLLVVKDCVWGVVDSTSFGGVHGIILQKCANKTCGPVYISGNTGVVTGTTFLLLNNGYVGESVYIEDCTMTVNRMVDNPNVTASGGQTQTFPLTVHNCTITHDSVAGSGITCFYFGSATPATPSSAIYGKITLSNITFESTTNIQRDGHFCMIGAGCYNADVHDCTIYGHTYNNYLIALKCQSASVHHNKLYGINCVLLNNSIQCSVFNNSMVVLYDTDNSRGRGIEISLTGGITPPNTYLDYNLLYAESTKLLADFPLTANDFDNTEGSDYQSYWSTYAATHEVGRGTANEANSVLGFDPLFTNVAGTLATDDWTPQSSSLALSAGSDSRDIGAVERDVRLPRKIDFKDF